MGEKKTGEARVAALMWSVHSVTGAIECVTLHETAHRIPALCRTGHGATGPHEEWSRPRQPRPCARLRDFARRVLLRGRVAEHLFELREVLAESLPTVCRQRARRQRAPALEPLRDLHQVRFGQHVEVT